jgi:hypothetical protein
MGISAEVLDFYDDSEQLGMAKVAMPSSLRQVPINLLEPDDHAALPDNEFGLVILTKRAHALRKFPVNDPGNAWLSAQYFDQNHEKLAFPARFIAAKFIKEACDAYKVPSSKMVESYVARAGDDIHDNTFVEGSEVQWMLRKQAQREFIEKQAAATEMDAVLQMPDGHFALVLQSGDGSVIRKYAMPDAAHVKVAAAYFDKYAMSLAPEHRHQFASSVKNRAEELGVDLPSDTSIEKWASSTWNTHVRAHLEHRKSLLPRNASARDVLDKLAAAIEETTPADLAQALTAFDEATGLERYYDKGLTDPYASTMGKVATGWSSDVDGQVITSNDLQKAASSKKLAGYLGESFATQFAKDPVSIFESLPNTEKVLIKQIINGEA